MVVMGIDYGEKNIGLAFGINNLVSPLRIISGKNDETAINEIARLALENKVKRLVIGIPLTYENKETIQAIKIRRFAKLLKIKLKIPVVFVNEYRTSEETMEEAIELDVSKKKRKRIDDLSAALILKKYFQAA